MTAARPWPSLAPWLAAGAGAAATFAAFWPGLMSVDSAAQFAQARGALPLDDVHPVLMSLAWRVTDALVPGPGGLFAGFVLAWWAGLAAWAQQWRTSAWRRVLLVLAPGLWPATFLILGHVWKDVGMTAALLLAGAATLHWRRRGQAWALVAAGLALLVAGGFRHNAVFGALPILAWALWPRAGEARQAIRRTLAALLFAGVCAALPTWLARAADAELRHPWTVVALWDLAALSLAADAVRLPPEVLAGPPLTVAELREHFDPWANPGLFGVGKIKSSFFHHYSAAQLAALRGAWWNAVRADPAAYLAHRARLARHLLLGFGPALPRELVYVPQRLVLPATPLALPAVDESDLLWRAAAAARSTPLFAGASYLGLALLALLLAAGRLHAESRAAVVALAASAWANALPLLLISGSAEFRYLAWTALASVLGAALALAGERDGIR